MQYIFTAKQFCYTFRVKCTTFSLLDCFKLLLGSSEIVTECAWKIFVTRTRMENYTLKWHVFHNHVLSKYAFNFGLCVADTNVCLPFLCTIDKKFVMGGYAQKFMVKMGFGLVVGFIEILQIVTASNYSAIANSHTLQFTIACTKPSQSAVSSPVVTWEWVPTP
jgi:hypothetical protein